MTIITDIEQGSEEWKNLKLGRPSASRANEIITSQGKPTAKNTRLNYMYELAAEIITQQRVEGFKSSAMETGNEREDESRTAFELKTGLEIEQVGVVYKDEKKEILCSPDGLINRKEGLELKNVLPKTQIKRLINNILPTEYIVQVQFSMYITGFKKWHFFSYCPGLRSLHIEAARDEKFIELLDIEIKMFLADLKELVEKIK